MLTERPGFNRTDALQRLQTEWISPANTVWIGK